MFNELLKRSTGGMILDKKTVLKPSLIYRLIKDPFGVWCDYHAEKNEAVEEISRYDQIRMDRGKAFEMQRVREKYPDAIKIEPEHGIEALVNTLRAMIAGVPAIYVLNKSCGPGARIPLASRGRGCYAVDGFLLGVAEEPRAREDSESFGL